jgi:hypothetical protein
VNDPHASSFDAPPDSIDLSPDVHIDFHPGAAHGVWWATLHIGREATEIGSVRGADDLSTVLTMAAGVLLERKRYVDDTHVGPSGRWVLIGRWVLSAVLSQPKHLLWEDESSARIAFNIKAGLS